MNLQIREAAILLVGVKLFFESLDLFGLLMHMASQLHHLSPDLVNDLVISRDRCQKCVVLGRKQFH